MAVMLLSKMNKPKLPCCWSLLSVGRRFTPFIWIPLPPSPLLYYWFFCDRPTFAIFYLYLIKGFLVVNKTIIGKKTNS
jgi:hypothetical protein